MNNKSLVKIINLELTILTDFIEDFNKDGNVDYNDIDLTLSKVKDIHDKLLLLKDSNVLESLPENKDVKVSEESAIIKPEQKEVEVEIEDEKPAIDILNAVTPSDDEVLPKDAYKDTSVEVEEQEVESVEAEITEVIKSSEEEQKIIIVDPTESDTAITSSEQDAVGEEEQSNNGGKIMADTFLSTTPSINDMLSSIKDDKNLASKLKDSPISNLKQVIKLNDKIWYISDLFNNSSADYEKAIDVVNESENLDSALEYLFNNFAWDQNKKSTISFLELVFRRFAQQ